MNCLLRESFAPAWISLWKTKHHQSIKTLLQKPITSLQKKGTTQVVQLLPLLLLQVATAVVKKEVHVLRESPLDDASAVVEEVYKLLRM